MGKTVFVLGAGFSKSFCSTMPVLDDFKKKIIDEKTSDSSKYPTLHEFTKTIFNQSNQTLEEIKHIESLATLILSKKIFQSTNERREFDILREELLHFIADQTRDISSITEDGKSILQTFLQEVRNDRHTIITFNYDLLIESIGENFSYPFVQAYSGEPKIFDANLMVNPPFEYLKLHGSLNWFQVKESTNISLDTVKSVGEESRYYSIHKNEVPVFIPMAHSKDNFLQGSFYVTLWAKAFCELDEAENIIFIGYSFPQTDLNNLTLFLRKEYKDKIRAVVIFDRSKNHKEYNRLSQIFDEENVYNVDAKEFIRKMNGLYRNTPQNIHYNLKLIHFKTLFLDEKTVQEYQQ